MKNNKNNLINKSTYLEYLKCEKNCWLKLHKPELFDLFALSEFEKNLAQKGNNVELCAQKLFPAGVHIEKLAGDSIANSQHYIEQKTSVLFQTTFTFDQFLARNDVLVYDHESDAWILYEIKSTNSLEENGKGIDHIEDASFQVAVLQKQGIKIGKIFIIHLNSQYVLNGDIDINKLFTFEDVTEKIKDRQNITLLKMEQAKIALFQTDENSVTCLCIYRGRSSQCETFSYTHKHVPVYSVHDLVRIGSSKKKLASLIDRDILNIDDVPADFVLSDSQKKQIEAYCLGKPLIDSISIKNELDRLVYPLYFLDYESYAPALPLFDGFKPYQQVPFQFSLYRVNNFGDQPIHYEYLHTSNSDPSLQIIEKLREFIGHKGNIIVWYKGFERMINAELGERNLVHKEFLSDLNDRIYDLMEIFSKQMYVHPDFRGRTSIKKVLPALIPELNYSKFNIKDGATASQKWFDMIFSLLSDGEKNQIADDLKRYCDLDTYAMYALWNFLIVNCSECPMNSENHQSPESKINSVSI